MHKVHAMRMSHVAALVAVSLLLTAPLHAQRLGLVVGGTFSQLRGFDDVNVSNRTGTMFGASLQLPFGTRTSVQGEALFVNKGTKVNSSTGPDYNVKLDYLVLPMLLRFDRHIGPGIGPHVYLGPSVGFNVGCSVTAESSGVPSTRSDCSKDNFDPKVLDWSGVVGAGVDLTMGGFGVTGGARYSVGLNNVSKTSAIDASERVRNGTFTVYAGVLFGRR